MNHIRIGIIVPASLLILSMLACNLPFIQAPTPIVFPTPDLTLTAIFSPLAPPATQVLPTETPPPLLSPTPSETPPPTATATSTETPLPTNTSTSTPLPTSTPTQSFVGPGMRPRYSLLAMFFPDPPQIDSNLEDWPADLYYIESVVYGKSNVRDAADLSARARLGWDEDYLYVAVRVIDDVFMQRARRAELFKGDSIEILLDTDVSGDYYYAALSADDFQLGISPGSPVPGEDPEAYLWYPRALEGNKDRVIIAARARSDGYVIEAAIPWSVFGVTPFEGRHFGFALSVSDNDDTTKNVQQSMISSSPIRILTDPTTWGDLTLVD